MPSTEKVRCLDAVSGRARQRHRLAWPRLAEGEIAASEFELIRGARTFEVSESVQGFRPMPPKPGRKKTSQLGWRPQLATLAGTRLVSRAGERQGLAPLGAAWLTTRGQVEFGPI